LKANFSEAPLYSSDAQLLSFRGLRIIRYGGTHIYISDISFFVALCCVLFSKFILRTLPSPTFVYPAVVMVTGRLILTAVVVNHIVRKLNWLGLFEKHVKIMKTVNYKDNLLAPIEQFFPKMC